MEEGTRSTINKTNPKNDAVVFCPCGRVAELKHGGIYCEYHFNKPPVKKDKIGKWTKKAQEARAQGMEP